MQTLGPSRRHTLVTSVAALVGLAGVLNVFAADLDESADVFIQRVLAQTTRSGIAIRALRHLEAGAVSGKHRGWMDVETVVTSSGTFSWNVLEEGGSERTRDRVFREILKGETEAWRAGAGDAAALSLANYQFMTESSPRAGQTQLRLKPRRADSRLIEGVLTVSGDGHPLVLEGRLVKSPSFWVRSVTVVKRYARVGGVSLPVSIESLADVRMVGQSSFSMRYRYTEVNGHSVAHTASTAPSFGPSPQIRALHAALTEGQ